MTSEDDHSVVPAGAGPQSSGAVRQAGRDGGNRAGTNGARGGTGGWRARLTKRFGSADPRDLRRGFVIVALVAMMVVMVNAMTTLADVTGIQTWEPWSWEITSAITTLLAIWIPWLTTAAAPPDAALGSGWRPKSGFLVVHLIGVLSFAALHVAGFVILRGLIYDWMDAGPYEFGDRFIYELRKDTLSYATFVATFWVLGYLRRRRDEPVRPVSFDIRDGARIIRAALPDIVAVSSAGNYVEFWLADGRRPLMRATLAAIEVELERFGFVRVHRSWLVNAARVTALEPDGSGDWTVELGGVAAPLSRRYPQALERLRSPG